MFPFLIKPDIFDGHELDLSLIEWLETQDVEMQLIELKSTLWVSKFAELRTTLESTVQGHGDVIHACWASLPKKFNCLRHIAWLYCQYSDQRICVNRYFRI